MTIYFARSIGVDRVKIGCVATGRGGDPGRHLWNRLVGLANKEGRDVVLEAETRGYRFVECWFHRRHRLSCVGGEWFSLSSEIANDIGTLRARGALEEQPAEPAITTIPARLMRHYRINLLKISQLELARATGLSLASVRWGEKRDPTVLRALGLAEVAAARGVPLTVRQILADAA